MPRLRPRAILNPRVCRNCFLVRIQFFCFYIRIFRRQILRQYETVRSRRKGCIRFLYAPRHLQNVIKIDREVLVRAIYVYIFLLHWKIFIDFVYAYGKKVSCFFAYSGFSDWIHAQNLISSREYFCRVWDATRSFRRLLSQRCQKRSIACFTQLHVENRGSCNMILWACTSLYMYHSHFINIYYLHYNIGNITYIFLSLRRDKNVYNAEFTFFE